MLLVVSVFAMMPGGSLEQDIFKILLGARVTWNSSPHLPSFLEVEVEVVGRIWEKPSAMLS